MRKTFALIAAAALTLPLRAVADTFNVTMTGVITEIQSGSSVPNPWGPTVQVGTPFTYSFTWDRGLPPSTDSSNSQQTKWTINDPGYGPTLSAGAVTLTPRTVNQSFGGDTYTIQTRQRNYQNNGKPDSVSYFTGQEKITGAPTGTIVTTTLITLADTSPPRTLSLTDPGADWTDPFLTKYLDVFGYAGATSGVAYGIEGVIQSVTETPAPTPEPPAALVLVLGALGVAGLARRRRSLPLARCWSQPLARRGSRTCRGMGPLAAAALAASALAAPASAQTLTLQSGDAVTISGAGTTGTYQGAPVNDPATAYSSSAASSQTVLVPAGSAFTLQSGGSLTAAGGSSAGVFSRGGSITVSGGTTSGTGSGGSGVKVDTHGTATITGGTLSSGSGPALFVVDSTATVSGGALSSNIGLAAWGNSNVAVSAGSITCTGGGDAITVGFGGGSSTVTISGGTVTAQNGGHLLTVNSGGTVNVSGGTFQPNQFSSQPTLSVSGGTLDLFGSFTGHNTGETITGGQGTITGILQDGSPFRAVYNITSGKLQFNVAAAPEPPQAATLGLSVLLLGGLILRRRAVRTT